jgi:hypothetical protein
VRADSAVIRLTQATILQSNTVGTLATIVTEFNCRIYVYFRPERNTLGSHETFGRAAMLGNWVKRT